MKGLCFLSAVPMRQQPSDKAEMVNQLLFGDTFSIVESQPKWSLVRCDADGYEGWVDNKQYLRLTAEEYNKIESTWCATGLRAGTVEVDGSLLPLPMGSRCPEPNDSPEQMAGMTFRTRWVERGEGLLQNAQQLLGSPYLWGGRTLMGIDCSGFTQVVFARRASRCCAMRRSRRRRASLWRGLLGPETSAFSRTTQGASSMWASVWATAASSMPPAACVSTG